MNSTGKKYLIYAFIIPTLLWIFQISLSFTLSMFFPETSPWVFHAITLICFILTIGLLLMVALNKKEEPHSMRYICLSLGTFISLIILISSFANVVLDIGARA